MLKTAKYIIAILAAAGIAIAACIWLGKPGKDDITVDRGRIADVTTMVQLCAMEIYNEVPILDTINNKVIIAVQKQTGSISFDVENLQVDDEGDTVRLTLPREILDIREATEDNSWQVIDTKNIGFLGQLKNGRLTLREENAVKAKAKRKAIRELYDNGTVRRTRTEAAVTLKSMMEKIYRKPVVVTDTTFTDKQKMRFPSK